MKICLIAFAFVALIAISGVESRPKGQRDEGSGDKANQNDGFITTTASDVTKDEDASSTVDPEDSTASESTEASTDDATTSVSSESSTADKKGDESTTKDGSSATSSALPASETTSEKTDQPSTSGSASPTPQTTEKPATSNSSFDPTRAMPTPEPTPAPSHRGGSTFDGWSFFGGILLTVGLSTVAFVGFKYYKARTGSGSMNYNRADDL